MTYLFRRLTLTVTIDCGENSSINAYGFDKEIIDKHAAQKTVGDKTYYVFPCSVAAKEMTSNITAQIIDGNDQGDSYTSITFTSIKNNI